MLHLYNRSDGRYEVEVSGEVIGEVTTYENPFHADFRYLSLEMSRYPTDVARGLFERISKQEKAPLQAMIYSYEREKAEFLLAGGFTLKRRCYEVKLLRGELLGELSGATLSEVYKGDSEYDECCRRVYDYYKATHEAINRLTASYDEFCAKLPETVLCERRNGEIIHLAFVERSTAESEIAYLHSTETDSFDAFGVRLLTELLAEGAVFFEADDCDLLAMRLRALKRNPDGTSFDTYTLRPACNSR